MNRSAGRRRFILRTLASASSTAFRRSSSSSYLTQSGLSGIRFHMTVFGDGDRLFIFKKVL
jgi:hypothetical protein